MKTVFLILCLVATLVAGQSTAAAWGAVEHQTVVRIAWENLSPQARENIIALLRRAPADTGLNKPSGQDALQQVLLASVWPDAVRANPALKQKYSCLWWHFIDFYWKDEKGVAVDVRELQPTPVHNTVERLLYFQKMLADKSEPASHRAVALAWFLHLVGDVHQPLHCSSRVTDTEPTGDLGGNRFRLERQTLHSYWDQILTRSAGADAPDRSKLVDQLAKDLIAEYPQSKLATRLQSGKIEEWGKESLEIAKTIVYDPSLVRGHEPSPEYRAKALKTARFSIALAGYRLAQMLNHFFEGGATVHDSGIQAQPKESVKDVESQLSYDFACADANLYNDFAELERIAVTLSSGRVAQGYDADKVKAIIASAKEKLLKSLDRDGLHGMRAYIDEYFPLASDLPVESLKKTSANRVTSMAGQLTNVPVSFSSKQIESWFVVTAIAKKAVEKARSFMDSAGQNTKSFTLQVNSTPSQANITLSSPDGKTVRTTSTDSPIPAFWRGIYDLKVTRGNDYRVIEQRRVNLWSDVRVITCPLVKKTERDEAIFCKFTQ